MGWLRAMRWSAFRRVWLVVVLLQLVIVAVTVLFGISYYGQLPALAALVSPDPSAFLLLSALSGLGSLAGVALTAARGAERPDATSAAVLLGVQGLVAA